MKDLSELNLLKKLKFEEIKHIINSYGFTVKRKQIKNIPGYSICFYYESYIFTTSPMDFDFYSLVQMINTLNDMKIILKEQRIDAFKSKNSFI